MAPQTSIPVAATVLGLIGTIFWCIQLCPQIWKSYRAKSTEGLPAPMMFLWASSAMPFGVYAISQNFNIPLQVQPQFFGTFCAISWAQCLYYGRKWPAWKAAGCCITLLALIAGLQVLFVLLFRGPYHRGKQWASDVVTFFGILACVMLIAGYLPVPAELIKRRGRVAGISLVFLLIDWSGAFFSLMSLVAQNSFDATFGTLYALVAFIEAMMFISHGVWRLRTRRLHAEAKAAGVKYDDYGPAIEWQSKGYDVGLTRLRVRMGDVVRRGRKEDVGEV